MSNELSRRRVATEKLPARAMAALAAVTVAMPALADAYAGQRLLEYARSFVIAPIGLFAIVVGIGASMFKPDLVKGAIWTAVICAFLFAIIGGAPGIMNAMQSG